MLVTRANVRESLDVTDNVVSIGVRLEVISVPVLCLDNQMSK